jgi:transcriptional regulator with XRE-family HTH domain
VLQFACVKRQRRPSREILKERLDELLPEDMSPDGTAKAIADRANIAESTLSSWRHGATPTNLKLDTLDRLAAALSGVLGRKISPCDLISESRLPPAGPSRVVLAQLEDAATQVLETLRVLRQQVDEE